MSGTVKWAASVTGSATKVVFYVDDSIIGTASTEPYSTALATSDFKNGKHTLTVKASGAGGTTATTTVTVRFKN